MTRPAQLIITADDLGIDPRRDDGILEAWTRGAITQASLLVGGKAAAAAARQSAMTTRDHDVWPAAMGFILGIASCGSKPSALVPLRVGCGRG